MEEMRETWKSCKPNRHLVFDLEAEFRIMVKSPVFSIFFIGGSKGDRLVSVLVGNLKARVPTLVLDIPAPEDNKSRF